MDYRTKPGSPAELAHHGVRGMKWGVRKERESVGRDSSGKITSATSESKKEAEYHRLAGKIVDQSGLNSHLLAAKYGPPAGVVTQGDKQHQADQERLKKVAKGLGIGLGAAALGIAAYKLSQGGSPGGLHVEGKLGVLKRTTNKAYRRSVDGLDLNWDNGVDLPKGFVLRRLSSIAETEPRPGGFFAAHLDSDVESYKAVLPTFWHQWGVGKARDGGFINHYAAKESIRAPSDKESFTLFKHLVDTDDGFNANLKHYLAQSGRGLSETQLKSLFVESSMLWVDHTNQHTQQWFKAVQSHGYNALIDFNDAGKLGKTPLRIIDGTKFDIVKNEPQSLDDFYTAAKKWSPELVLIHFDDFLRRIESGQAVLLGNILELEKTIVHTKEVFQ